MATASQLKNQQRTAVIYFGSERETYLHLVQAENRVAFVQFLRSFLPDAKSAGKSLVEVFGASLRGIPWMEALNLCTVGRLSDLVPASG